MRTLRLIPVLLLAPLLHAGELDRAATRWAQQCMSGLASKSEIVRASAARALTTLGVDAMPVVVKKCTSLRSQESWMALEIALEAMGRRTAAARLDGLRGKWPSSAKKRLEELYAFLNFKGAEGDPEVAEKVRKLLAKFEGANSYSSDDANVKAIVALGRPAVPCLIGVIRASNGFGMELTAACDALEALVEKKDLPALTDLLASGKLDVAQCLRPLKSEEALDALLIPLGKGKTNYELFDALRAYKDSKRMRAALVRYLKSYGSTGDQQAGRAAEFAGEVRAYEALPALEALLPLRGESGYQRSVATGLVLLGAKKGIPLLIELFAEGGDRDGWERHTAGETLNDVVGQRAYKGTFGGSAMTATGNFDEAVAWFRDWWKDHEDEIVFDREKGRWVSP